MLKRGSVPLGSDGWTNHFAWTMRVVAAWQTVHLGRVLCTPMRRAGPLPAPHTRDLVPGLSVLVFW